MNEHILELHNVMQMFGIISSIIINFMDKSQCLCTKKPVNEVKTCLI